MEAAVVFFFLFFFFFLSFLFFAISIWSCRCCCSSPLQAAWLEWIMMKDFLDALCLGIHLSSPLEEQWEPGCGAVGGVAVRLPPCLSSSLQLLLSPPQVLPRTRFTEKGVDLISMKGSEGIKMGLVCFFLAFI